LNYSTNDINNNIKSNIDISSFIKDENNYVPKRKFIDETEKLYKKFKITSNMNINKFEENQELYRKKSKKG